MEIGPYRLKDENTLVLNDGSWHEFANLLFVDNPVGTGFSYVDTDSYVHELDEMADQFLVFLEKFFAIFPEYEQDDVRNSWGRITLRRSILICYPSSSTFPASPTLANTSLTSQNTYSNATSSKASHTSGTSKAF